MLSRAWLRGQNPPLMALAFLVLFRGLLRRDLRFRIAGASIAASARVCTAKGEMFGVGTAEEEGDGSADWYVQ